VWPHHHTKMVGLCGRLITLRREACVAASLQKEGRCVWLYHYTKRGGLCDRIFTLRGDVCVAV